jgi:hypothetical protein
MARGNPRFVVAAGEYKTEKGDLIGLFLVEDIRASNCDQVIREIKQQGGLVVLPHPFKGHKLDEALLGGVDLIESYNCRCSSSENDAAEELARKLGKPSLGGCDAHFSAELGGAINEFSAPPPQNEEELRTMLLCSPRSLYTRPVPRVYRPLSQMIKAIRTRDLYLFISQAERAAAILQEDMSSRRERKCLS